MTLQFEVGRTYRAKKPRNSNGFVNDRIVLYVGATGNIQYNSPSVGFCRHFPKVTREAFEKLAGEDVTDKTPKDEWQPRGLLKEDKP